MKRILVLLLAASLLASCNSNPFNAKKPNADDQTNNNNKNDNNGNGSWARADRDKYLKQCLDEAGNSDKAKKVCPCVLDKLEKKYPDIKDADRATEEEGRTLAMQCLNDLGMTPGGNTGDNGLDNNRPNNNGGDINGDDDGNNGRTTNSWTTTQRNQFIQGCAGQAQQNFGYTAQQANSYCDCLTRKVEQQYTFQQAARMTAQDFSTEEWERARQDCQPRF